MRLTSFYLKIVAMVFMFTEHLGLYLGELLPHNYAIYASYPGRIVAPIFFFLAVEGTFKTSSRRNYIARLYLWAGIMELGNSMLGLLAQRFTHLEKIFFVENNIFLSIALGVSLISVLEWTKKQHTTQTKVVGFLCAIALALVSIFTESSFTGLAMFAVFYLFYNKRPGLYRTHLASL